MTDLVTPPAELTPGGGRLLEWTNEAIGKVAVVVGSGPSLADFPRSLLDDPRLVTIAINDELKRSAGVFSPTYWMFSDPPYYRRVIEAHQRSGKPELRDDLKIITSQYVINAAFRESPSSRLYVPPYPPILDRAAVFEGSRREWDPSRGRFMLFRTTATAAIGLAHWIGCERVILLGVDCYCTDEAYYHDGSKSSQKKRQRSWVPIGDGRYMNDLHLKMEADLVALAKSEPAREMEVIQWSRNSPIECFARPNGSWEETVAGGRSS